MYSLSWPSASRCSYCRHAAGCSQPGVPGVHFLPVAGVLLMGSHFASSTKNNPFLPNHFHITGAATMHKPLRCRLPPVSECRRRQKLTALILTTASTGRLQGMVPLFLYMVLGRKGQDKHPGSVQRGGIPRGGAPTCHVKMCNGVRRSRYPSAQRVAEQRTTESAQVDSRKYHARLESEMSASEP